MDKKLISDLYNEVNILNSTIELYNGLLNKTVDTKEKKENIEIKAELLKEEALKHNLKIRQLIDKTGY